MKKYIISLVFLILAPAAFAQMIVITPEKAKRAKKYTELRLKYAKSKDYAPYDRDYREAEKKAERMFFDEKKHTEALAEIEPFLKKNPYCITLLQLKAAMLREMGKIKDADKVRQIWFGVVDSIMASGDGRSPETAVHVISTVEEYDVLRIREWDFVSQRLITHENHNYDVMTVKDRNKPEGEPFDVYFNIDLPFGSLQKMFSQ